MTNTPPTRLARRLNLLDASTVGLGAMIGAGIFVALAPAARSAGSGLPLSILLAAFVAACNASSMARLAAAHPESGGAYVYARVRLSPFWGFLAGWCFVGGKLASLTAMALTFGAYVVPSAPRAAGAAAALGLTAINLFGIRKSVGATKLILTVILFSLAAFVFESFDSGAFSFARLRPDSWFSKDPKDLLEGAGIMFFAFAGYARLATLGEEVKDPERTIPRAIGISLASTLMIYAAVALAAIGTTEIDILANAPAPLIAAVHASEGPNWLVHVLRIGAATATLGVLLSLLIGVSRTIFAMASRGELPIGLARVHARHKTPHRAELATGFVVALLCTTGGAWTAIGISGFSILLYYAIANAAALARGHGQPTRGLARLLSGCGFLLCLLLAFSLPRAAWLSGAALVSLGRLLWRVVRKPPAAA